MKPLTTILFLCTGNSCRSQIAEGYARHLAGDRFAILSAGIEAHGKNPRAIAVMAEDGIDISAQESTRLTEAMLADVDIIVTVCGHADEHCPAVPTNKVRKLHWPLSDPARVGANDDMNEDQIMTVFRASRDDIRERVRQLLNSL